MTVVLFEGSEKEATQLYDLMLTTTQLGKFEIYHLRYGTCLLVYNSILSWGPKVPDEDSAARVAHVFSSFEKIYFAKRS